MLGVFLCSDSLWSLLSSDHYETLRSLHAMDRRGIPPPPGFEDAARPSQVPDDASREALPLQVPSAVAPRLLHHVPQPSYMPHPHTQIPVRPPMIMHCCHASSWPDAREYTCAQRLEKREPAPARSRRRQLMIIPSSSLPPLLLALSRARKMLAPYLNQPHAPPFASAPSRYYGPQHHHSMMMFDRHAYPYGATRPPENALARRIGLADASGSAGSLAGAAIGVLMMKSAEPRAQQHAQPAVAPAAPCAATAAATQLAAAQAVWEAEKRTATRSVSAGE